MISLYNGNPQAGGALIADVPVPALAPGAQLTSEYDWNVPGAEGQYDLYLVVDSPSVFSEWDETNNISHCSVTVGPIVTVDVLPPDHTCSAQPISPSVLTTPAGIPTAATLDGDPYSWGTPISTEGDHILAVDAPDGCGRTRTALTLHYTVDLTLPVVHIGGVQDGGSYTESLEPTFQSSDLHLAETSALLNGAPFVSGTTISAPGNYTLDATARDCAGNTGEAIAHFILAASGPPAAPTLSSPADGSTVAGLTPDLTILNPYDPDGDGLYYSFEVFADALLANRVCNGGTYGPCCSGFSSYTVSPAIEPSRWYWWQSQAEDALHMGPRMIPATFFTSPFPMPELGEYGFLPAGDQARGDRIAYTFPGTAGDVVVIYQAYNIPSGQEDPFRILLNGADLGTQGEAVPAAWSVTRSILLPDALVSDSAMNTLSFTNQLNSPGSGTAEWGIRKVGIDVLPPNSVTAWPYDTVVDITWAPRPGVAGYNVWRSPSPGGPYSKLNGTTLTGMIYRDINLTNGMRYYYVVRSVSQASLEGGDSIEVSAVPTALAGVTPTTDLTITKSGDDLKLDWTPISTAGGVKRYKIYLVSPESSPPYTRTGAPVLGAPATNPYYHTGAASDSNLYFYDIATVNNSDQEAGD